MKKQHNQKHDAAEATKEQKTQLLDSMDVTMRQKIALTSPYFNFHDGAKILDLGCARGKGSYELALLHPNLEVVGLDYDENYIQEAKKKYKLPNLSFVKGDARDLQFEEGYFDAILNSSIQHEIFSFSGYDYKALKDAMSSQLKCLKTDGVVLLRDFVQPDIPDAMVYLDLPVGKSTGSKPSEISYPDLLRYYSRIANNEKEEPLKGFFCEDIGEVDNGWERFYLPHKWAYEFIWRKEYRERFVPEASEQYAMLRAEDYRKMPEENGARVVYQTPVYNPWIVKKWHEGKFRIFNEDLQLLEGPPTNYVAVIQKIKEGDGLILKEHKQSGKEPSYLKMEHFINKNHDKYDLASRPGTVLDVIPYRWNEGELFIYAKNGYPRPIVNIHPRQMSSNLDGRQWAGYMIEPLAVANKTSEYEGHVKELLKDRGGISPDAILSSCLGLEYFTAPADTNEKVSSVMVELNDAPYETALKGAFSNFSSDGGLKSFNARSLLSSVQVGMLPEPRLEVNLYALMFAQGVQPEKWIGDEYKIEETSQLVGQITSIEEVDLEEDDKFVKSCESSRYLKTLSSVFTEEASVKGHRQVIAHHEFEFVVPDRGNNTDISTNNIMIVPILKDKNTGEILIGLEKRNFPSVQEQEGKGGILTVPGMRLPSAVKNMREAKDFMVEKFPGVDRSNINKLGESYFPSMGIQPNRMYPFIVSDEGLLSQDSLKFVPLREVFVNCKGLRDLHLMVVAMRSVHALGLWEEYSKPNQHHVLSKKKTLDKKNV